MPDWVIIEQGPEGTILEYGHLHYRVAPNGVVYVRYYRRHEQQKPSGANGGITERRLKGGGIKAIAARHAAYYLSKEAA